jgi:hypothetical protein
VVGTKNIIKYCKEFDKKLYHISTMSVAGISSIDEDVRNDDERTLFSEEQLAKIDYTINTTHLSVSEIASKIYNKYKEYSQGMISLF